MRNETNNINIWPFPVLAKFRLRYTNVLAVPRARIAAIFNNTMSYDSNFQNLHGWLEESERQRRCRLAFDI